MIRRSQTPRELRIPYDLETASKGSDKIHTADLWCGYREAQQSKAQLSGEVLPPTSSLAEILANAHVRLTDRTPISPLSLIGIGFAHNEGGPEDVLRLKSPLVGHVDACFDGEEFRIEFVRNSSATPEYVPHFLQPRTIGELRQILNRIGIETNS